MLAQWNSALRTSFGGFHRSGPFLRGQIQFLILETHNVLLWLKFARWLGASMPLALAGPASRDPIPLSCGIVLGLKQNWTFFEGLNNSLWSVKKKMTFFLKKRSKSHAGSHVVIIDPDIQTEISYIRLTLRLVVGGGFEPPKASPTDLQSVPFDHSGTPPVWYIGVWSQRQELNPRHPHYKWGALPTELLWQRSLKLCYYNVYDL